MKCKIILCLCLAFSLTLNGVLGYMLWDGYTQQHCTQQELADRNDPTENNSTADEATVPERTEAPTEDPLNEEIMEQQAFAQLSSNTFINNAHDMKVLRGLNSECAAWLTIPGTIVDYPVMYTPNNPGKYVYKSFSGRDSVSGCPFIDAGCTVSGDRVIIYGQNAKSGTMFAPLRNYENKSYAQEHSVIRLETEQGIRNYTVYAAARVKRGDVIFSLRNTLNKTVFDQMIGNLSNRALFMFSGTPQYGQKLLVLSTYTDTDYDDRMIVVAVQK